MGKCLSCGNVVSTREMKEGLCKECYTPEKAQEMKVEMAIKNPHLIELVKGDKRYTFSYKRDWFLTLIGVLIGFLGPFVPLMYGDWRGMLKVLFLFMVYAVVAATLYEKGILGMWGVFTLNLGFWLLIGHLYPRMRLQHLLKEGYEPADEINREKLEKLRPLA